MIEGEDYYLNDEGLLVLSAQYLSKRGYCCGKGCLHCPYNYEQVSEPERSFLIKERSKKST